MESNQIDTEHFLSEVQKYPVLWDINSEDYRYLKRRQRAWSKIASVFIDRFDDIPNSEKTIFYKKLHDKWRNIRDSYVKSKRSNSKKNYMYAAQLIFLDEIYKNDDTSNNIKSIKKEKREFDDSNDAWPSDDSNLESKKKKTEGIEFVDSFPDMTCNTIFTEEDEDRSFFSSLLPAVRQFSVDQKLEFRSEVISIIKKIRAGLES
ncbi:unnamed protein product [Diatraea saccharalis]|uniref:MADF domain-containing protein n=1 Tax=Diatraea saccharalis TaxID=40085 RepID=A0A9N9R7S0_9NEOP|nr:unnamed protein product [Diatraea saccharalis]